MTLKPLPRRSSIRLRLLTMFVLILIVNMSGSGTLAEQRDEDGAWFQAPPAFHGTGSFPALALADGRILVTANPPLIYDPHLGNWQEGQAHEEMGMPGWRPQAGVELPDGRILVAGGVFSAGISPGSTGTSAMAAIYDRSDGSWQDIASLEHSRLAPSLIALDDGSVLAAGGAYGAGVGLGSGSNVRQSVERYYPELDTWVNVGDLSAGGMQHSPIALDDGTVLYVGGASAGWQRATVAEIYDPVSDEWRTVTVQLPDTLFGHAATRLPDGTILITGGSIENPPGVPMDPVDQVLLLDPESGGLESLSGMTFPRMDHTATRLTNGEVLVTGGSTLLDDELVVTNTAEIFDPSTGDWRAVATMNEARSGHFAVSLPGGEASQGADAYVIGMQSPSVIPVPAEVVYLQDPGPFDRQPPPSAPHPSFRYFTETGQYLAWGFRNFWEQNGGLPVFGFPLSAEFDELNPDLDELRISQYFERQRFEYHPEHAGSPYEVQLGRLGVVDAENRGLLDHEAFVPVDDAPNGCHYFSETGHTLCGTFQSYWDRHGRDFGDPGVSFRESLALFGYPISEEFVDPDSGLTIQYFERARFEHHPDNPEQHQVLLGRLAADLVGWENE